MLARKDRHPGEILAARRVILSVRCEDDVASLEAAGKKL